MNKSRKTYKVNIQGMIVEEVDERDDQDFDKMEPPDGSESIILNKDEQVVPLSA